MGTCIKTGSVLKIITTNISGEFAEAFKYDANIKGDYIYGDTHLVGKSCIIYFPEYQDRKYKSDHGNLFILNNNYFYRNTIPYKILVIPATWIQFKDDALRPFDLSKYKEASKYG